jgi:hypothetical protein
VVESRSTSLRGRFTTAQLVTEQHAQWWLAVVGVEREFRHVKQLAKFDVKLSSRL